MTNSTIRLVTRKMGSALQMCGSSLREWATRDVVTSPPAQSKRLPNENLALVAGYFSFKEGLATFGDTEAMRVVTDWLTEAGIHYDVACHPSNGVSGLNIDKIDPASYNIFVFVCGPWRNENNPILERFGHCIKIGINLSLADATANRFDLLFPRDMVGENNPDLVFASRVPNLPLIGVCLVHPQFEYGARQRHARVKDAVNRYLAQNQVAHLDVDTLYRNNNIGIRSAVAFENLIARLDVVISTRLHGLVFALKRGVPVVAIDPIAGGEKVTRQAASLGWPIVINGDDVDHKLIAEAVDLCLTTSMKTSAGDVRGTTLQRLGEVKAKFMQELRSHLPNMCE